GWRAAFLIVAAVAVVVVIAAQPTRNALDIRNPDRKPFSLAAMLSPLRTILRTPRLLELSIAGFAFAAVQVSLSSFLVVFLTESLRWSLVASGLALTFATMAAVPGRIVWGAIADRSRAPTLVLATIGLLACACGIAFAFAGPSWPAWVMLPLAAVYGLS